MADPQITSNLSSYAPNGSIYLSDGSDGQTSGHFVAKALDGTIADIHTGATGGGAIATVHGRTGAIVAAAGDYTAALVDVVATPTNYTAATADIEAHLAGIDTALASAGGVSSVHGRTGAVVAVAGDYTATQVTVTAAGFTGNLSATDTTVQTALATIDGLSLGAMTAADAIPPASDDATGAIGTTTTEFALEDHKHPAQGVSADAGNLIAAGTDGLHQLAAGVLDSDSALPLLSNDMGQVSQDAVKTVVLGAAPVDGTTVAYYVGQLFWDNVNKSLYEATAASTDPDAAGTGSTFAQVSLGGGATVSYVYDIAARDALTPAAGDVAIVQDQATIYEYDGAAWFSKFSPNRLTTGTAITASVVSVNTLTMGADIEFAGSGTDISIGAHGGVGSTFARFHLTVSAGNPATDFILDPAYLHEGSPVGTITVQPGEEVTLCVFLSTSGNGYVVWRTDATVRSLFTFQTITDLGNGTVYGGDVANGNYITVQLVTAGAGETRTINAPLNMSAGDFLVYDIKGGVHDGIEVTFDSVFKDHNRASVGTQTLGDIESKTFLFQLNNDGEYIWVNQPAAATATFIPEWAGSTTYTEGSLVRQINTFGTDLVLAAKAAFIEDAIFDYTDWDLVSQAGPATYNNNISMPKGMLFVEGGAQYRSTVTGGSGNSFQDALDAGDIVREDAGMAEVRVDASGAAYSATLPLATGSNSAVLYILADATNTATLVPSAGESLNGIADGVFFFSNFVAGTQFLATDRSAGQWDVSVIGASSEVASKFYHWEGAFDNFELTNADDDFEDFDLSSAVASTGAGSYYMDPANEIDPDGFRSGNLITVPAGNYRVEYAVDWPGFTIGATNAQNDHGNWYAKLRIGGSDLFNGGNANPSADGVGSSSVINRDFTFTAATTIELGVSADGDQGIDSEDLTASITIEEIRQPTEVTLAGMVASEELSYGRMRDAAGGNIDLNALAPVTFDTTDYTNGLSANPATGQFTVTDAGRYEISTVLSYGGLGTAGGLAAFAVIDGGAINLANSVTGHDIPGSAFYMGMSGSLELDLTAGQTVELHVATENGTTPASDTITRALNVNTFSIRRLPTSSVVNPGSVPVEDLEYAFARKQLAGTMGVGGGIQVINCPTNNDPAAVPTTASRLSLAAPDEATFSGAVFGTDDITVNTSGRYDIAINVVTDFGSTSSQRTGIKVVKNGAEVLGYGWGYTVSGNANDADDYSVNWHGELAAGDVIDFRFDGQTAVTFDVKGYSAKVAQVASKTITYLDPAFTEAKDLHRANVSGASVVVTANKVMLSTQAGGQVYDPAGLLVSNEFVIQNAGTYRVYAHCTDATSSTIQIRVNGVSQVSGTNVTSGPSGSDQIYVGDLAIGDVVDFQNANGTTPMYNFAFGVEQLPSTEYVTPGDVPVEDLHRAHFNSPFGTGDLKSGVPNGGINNIDFSAASLQNVDGITWNGTDEFTIVNAGVYKVEFAWTGISGAGTGQFTQQVDILKGAIEVASAEAFNTVATIGVSSSASCHYEGDFLAGDVIKLTIEGGGNVSDIKGASFTIAQQSTKTVVRPEDLATSDQSASGYIDLGTTRIAWGKSPGTNNSETVTFPGGGFASPPTVTMSVEDSALRETRIDAVTTTTVLLANGTANAIKHWHAIGIKP